MFDISINRLLMSTSGEARNMTCQVDIALSVSETPAAGTWKMRYYLIRFSGSRPYTTHLCYSGHYVNQQK